MLSSKSYFVEHIIDLMGKEKPLRILDLGSGTSQDFLVALKKNPHITYVGVEPSPRAARIAKDSVKNFPNATIHNQLGYGEVPGALPESFDIVVSLSVLEHVKHLDPFIRTSVQYAKKGGLIIHRYDLGHALSPSSLKETVQVWLGSYMPAFLSERTFVRYLSETEVRASLTRAGVSSLTKTTYHQMPSHKLFEKIAKEDQFNYLKEQLYAWEFEASKEIAALATTDREALFPSIAVWATK